MKIAPCQNDEDDRLYIPLTNDGEVNSAQGDTLHLNIVGIHDLDTNSFKAIQLTETGRQNLNQCIQFDWPSFVLLWSPSLCNFHCHVPSIVEVTDVSASP